MVAAVVVFRQKNKRRRKKERPVVAGKKKEKGDSPKVRLPAKTAFFGRPASNIVYSLSLASTFVAARMD